MFAGLKLTDQLPPLLWELRLAENGVRYQYNYVFRPIAPDCDIQEEVYAYLK